MWFTLSTDCRKCFGMGEGRMRTSVCGLQLLKTRERFNMCGWWCSWNAHTAASVHTERGYTDDLSSFN